MDWIIAIGIAITVTMVFSMLVFLVIMATDEGNVFYALVKVILGLLLFTMLTVIIRTAGVAQAHTSTVTATVPATIWNTQTVGGLSTQVRVVIE